MHRATAGNRRHRELLGKLQALRDGWKPWKAWRLHLGTATRLAALVTVGISAHEALAAR